MYVDSRLSSIMDTWPAHFIIKQKSNLCRLTAVFHYGYMTCPFDYQTEKQFMSTHGCLPLWIQDLPILLSNRKAIYVVSRLPSIMDTWPAHLIIKQKNNVCRLTTVITFYGQSKDYFYKDINSLTFLGVLVLQHLPRILFILNSCSFIKADITGTRMKMF